jgi:hypothetical protein
LASDERRKPTGTCPACGRYRWSQAKLCRRRNCPGYAPIWAGDQRNKLFENLKALESLPDLATDGVGLVTVTAPGVEVLPWDRHACSGLGEHECSGLLGCRVDRQAAKDWNKRAPAQWRRLHRRAYQRTKSRYRRFWMPARVWELQSRGVLHAHVVVPYGCGVEMAAADFYVNQLHVMSAKYGFGFVDRKLRRMSAKGAAAYLSAYFVSGKREKAQLHESVMSPAMPRSIVHVSNRLTRHTGITMRELRFRRFVWVVAGDLVKQDPAAARRVAGFFMEHQRKPVGEEWEAVLRGTQPPYGESGDAIPSRD